MLKIQMDRMKEHNIVKAIYNKRVGTLKMIKLGYNLYYICFRELKSEVYECYSVDMEYYNSYKKFFGTELNEYYELDKLFIHCKWKEYCSTNYR